MAKTTKTVYLRLPPSLYFDLKRGARDAEESVNKHAVKLLLAAVGGAAKQ